MKDKELEEANTAMLPQIMETEHANARLQSIFAQKEKHVMVALASVEPPDVWYKLALPDEIIDEGKLSALQLEAVVYAGQQHEQRLTDGNRQVCGIF